MREWFFGQWQGRTFAEIGEAFPKELALYREISPHFRPSGGESIAELICRAGDFLQKTAESNPGKTVLCVSHGAFIRAVLQYVMKLERFAARPRVDNTALSSFKTTDGGKSWQLVLWNDTSHLLRFTESEGV